MKTRKTKNKPKRKYDGTSRLQKSRLVEHKIIETYVQLLAENRGEDAQFNEIAKRSGISERTIFRLFHDKESLSAATNEYTHRYLLSTSKEVSERSVPGFAKYLFGKFDEHEDLVIAYLYSRFGMNTRAGFRKKFNELVIQQICREKKLEPTKEQKLKLAVIASLINAKIWHDLRTDTEFSGEEIGDAVGDAISRLIDTL